MSSENSPVSRIPNKKNESAVSLGHVASNATFQSIKRRDSAGSLTGTRLPPPAPQAQLQAAQPPQLMLPVKLVTKTTRRQRSAEKLVPVPSSSIQTQRLRTDFDDANRSIASLEKRLEATKRLQNLDVSIDRKRSNTFTSIYSGSVNSISDSNASSDNVLLTPSEGNDFESSTWKLGDILQSLGDKERKKEYLVARSNELITILAGNPELKDDLVLNAFGNRIQFLLTHNVSEVRACGYRIARYILHKEDSLRMLIQLRVELFLVLTFARDNKALLEKEQALKLVRQLVSLPDGAHTLTISLLRAIVSIAESSDDKLKNHCIETLCEFSLYTPGLVYKADGLKVIIQSLIEGPFEMAPLCLLTVLKLLEVPEGREYIIDQANISYFVSSFCDVHQKSHTSIEKLQNNAFMLTIFLKTWPGLFCLSKANFSALRDLVNCLAFDIVNLRDILMDVFFDVLKIRKLPWIDNSTVFSSALQQKPLVPQNAAPQQQQHKSTITPSEPEKQETVVNHYTALILLVLLRCNITDRLVSLISSSSDDLNKRKAIYLLTEIVSLTNELIPLEVLKAEHQVFDRFLPILLDSEFVDFKVPSASIFQMARLSDRLNKTKLNLKDGNIVDKAHLRKMPFNLKYHLDDLEFRKMLNDTRILTTKEYDHWNWDLISDLMQGPLLNGKRLEETIRTTKVIKRLMSFFRPFKFRFSKISRRNKNSARYIRVGCELFEMLLHTDEGVKFLTENKLLAQIAECIAQVDPYSGITSPDSLFSRHKLETTVSSGYFKMLGVLSRDPNGLKMLAQWKIFSMFYHITEAKRDDLIKLIVQLMDLKLPGHLRIIFTKVMTNCDPDLRIFALEHLATLLPVAEDTFFLKLLMDQLYDSDAKVADTAVQVLDKFISDPDALNKVIDLKPDLYHLSKVGHSTLLRFLATSKGFNYLDGFKIIERELKEWTDYKIFKYVYDIENLMINELVQPELHNNLIFKQSVSATAASPRHFFGELVKIDEGVKLINESGLIEKISRKMKSFKSPAAPNAAVGQLFVNEDEVIQLKGYMWCIGHICSSKKGIKLFENRNLIEDVIGIAKDTTNLSLKGTCFLVLGLIAKTPEGLEILDENGWCCKVNINNQLIGLCLPMDLKQFLDAKHHREIKSNKFENYANLSAAINTEFNSLNPGDFLIAKRVFENFINLLSHLLVSKSISNLKNIKARNEQFFSVDKNMLILYKILIKLMANFRYSKTLRKFLLNDFIDCSFYLKLICKKDRVKTK